MQDIIYKRKSVRSFEQREIDAHTLQLIETKIQQLRPLYPHIHIEIKVVDGKEIRSLMRHTTSKMIAIYSGKSTEACINAGFMGQQLELYLQSLGLGVCWLGMSNSKTKEEYPFLISLAFGYPKGEQFRSLSDFNRKNWNDFSDSIDERLKPAYYAPSSINSQPWYFTHEGNKVHLWYVPKKGMFKSLNLEPNRMNGIDLGICLAHEYIVYPNIHIITEKVKPLENYKYICTIEFEN